MKTMDKIGERCLEITEMQLHFHGQHGSLQSEVLTIVVPGAFLVPLPASTTCSIKSGFGLEFGAAPSLVSRCEIGS